MSSPHTCRWSSLLFRTDRQMHAGLVSRAALRRATQAALVAGLIGGVASPARAQIWVGTTSDWGTVTNWSPVGVPAPGANVTLAEAPITIVNLNIDRTVGQVTFNSTKTFVLGGNTLTLTGVTAAATAPTYVINSAVNMSGSTTWDVLGSMTVGGQIMGGSLTKTGAGTLTLSGSNTYSGTTTINAGVLGVNADARLGAAPGAPTPGKLAFGGGTLRTTATFTLDPNRGVALNAGGGTFQTNGNTMLTYGGTIAGSGNLTKDGAGTLILSGASSSSGALNVNNGVLQLDGALTPSGDVAVAAAGTLNLQTTGVLKGNGANGTIGSPGAPGRSVATAGALAMSGAGLQINLDGGAGGPGIFPGAGGAGGNLNVTGGTATLSNSTVASLNGGGAPDNPNGSQPGGAGGTLNVTAGIATLSNSSVVNLNGGRGSGGSSHAGAGGAGGTIGIAGGALSLSGSSAMNLTGNAGGGSNGAPGSTGGNGGAGGSLSVTGGSVSMTGTSILNFAGGPGGGASNTFSSGGAGGAGGSVQLSNGAFDMTGGKIIVTGGLGGPASGFASQAGPPGAAGHVDVAGGTFNFTAGQITADSSITPATPAAVVKSTLNVNGGTATITAPLDLVQATVNLSAGVMNAVAINRNTSAFNFTGGTLHVDTFNGSLTQNGGALAVGNAVNSTTIIGDYTQNSGSLAIEIGGTMPGSDYDRVEVEGVANLMGTLDVTLTNSFLPTLGDSFGFLFASGGFSSNFAALNLPDISGLGLGWRLNPGDSTLFLNVVAALPGDFDHDGDVDGRDFLAWQRNPSVGNLADWQTNYGSAAPSTPTTAAVPEPATALLCLAAAAWTATRRRSA